MVNPWDRWDARLRETGDPRRAAECFTDEELLAMLAHESDGRRQIEKRFVKQEIFDRLSGQAPATSAPHGHEEPGG